MRYVLGIALFVVLVAGAEFSYTFTHNNVLLYVNDTAQAASAAQAVVSAPAEGGATTTPASVSFPSDPPKSTMIFAGDIMLARGIGNIIKSTDDELYPFQYVIPTLRKADIVFANLESVIASGGTKQGTIYSFRADPHTILGLKAAGVSVVSVANNHVGDYGPAAYAESMRHLADAGIAYVGGGQSYNEAHTPVVITTNAQKIAFLGYSQFVPMGGVTGKDAHPALADIDKAAMKRDIARAKQEADIVVVSFHWGTEYETTHNAFQEEIAHAAIDDGATLVIGHHPHVAQDTERYKNGFIAYSLGNFVFDQNFSPETHTSEVLRVTAQRGKVTHISIIPIAFNSDFQPYFTQ